ncbi:MAG: hypothetical protein KDA24_19630 [Deltaproteobacteria bacterium]|nr:hypothetical protein [Deltaproteobacteria bacterium]
MLVDHSALIEGQTLRADLVTVGAGVAGITLARRRRTPPVSEGRLCALLV